MRCLTLFFLTTSSKSDILYLTEHLSSNQPHLSAQWPSVSSGYSTEHPNSIIAYRQKDGMA